MDYKKAGVDIEAGYQSVEVDEAVCKKDYAPGGLRRTRRFFRGFFDGAV